MFSRANLKIRLRVPRCPSQKHYPCSMAAQMHWHEFTPSLLGGAESRKTVCVVCLQLFTIRKPHENTSRGCSALFACHHKRRQRFMKQRKVCFSVSGNAHYEAVEPCWLQPQNCWCKIDLVSAHILVLSTLPFIAGVCHATLWRLARTVWTNACYWAKTLTALSISPHLIRRSPGWLDVQSTWLGKLRKALKKKKVKKANHHQDCSPSPFISTHCLHRSRQTQSVPS